MHVKAGEHHIISFLHLTGNAFLASEMSSVCAGETAKERQRERKRVTVKSSVGPTRYSNHSKCHEKVTAKVNVPPCDATSKHPVLEMNNKLKMNAFK